MRTYNDIYMSTRNALLKSGDAGYALEARVLVSTAAGKTTTELLRDLNLYASPAIDAKVQEYTQRRLKGEPVAYITGQWEFYGLPMYVNSSVLIPRMDTEIMVDAAKELLIGHKMDARVLDLCCGSGCIACAVGHEMPAAKLVAVDISASALEVCRRNIALNRLSNRAICVQADALSSPPMSLGQFDMIVCNPPYIPSGEIMTLDKSVRDFEPIWALDGGDNGLKYYKSIIKFWKSVLSAGGYLLFEVGEDQADAVREMLLSAGFRSVKTRKDTLGVDRVVIGQI